MSGCCRDIGCRRKKPVKLMRSDLTGSWYVVTAYTDCGDGLYRATTKHELEPEMQAQLEAMRDAFRDQDKPARAAELGILVAAVCGSKDALAIINAKGQADA